MHEKATRTFCVNTSLMSCKEDFVQEVVYVKRWLGSLAYFLSGGVCFVGRTSIAAIALFVVNTALGFGQPETKDKVPGGLLNEMQTIWEQRRLAHYALRCDLTGTGFVPKNSRERVDSTTGKVELFPSEDHAYPIKLTIILDFRNGRARRYEQREVFDFTINKFRPEVIVDLFNGTDFQQFFPRIENEQLFPQYSKWTPDLINRGTRQSAVFFRAKEYPILAYFGLIPESLVSPLKLRAPQRRSSLSLERQVGDIVVAKYNENTSQRTRTVEYWFDKSNNHSVVRRSKRLQGVDTSIIDIVYENIANADPHFPTSWRITTLTGNVKQNRIDEICDLHVDQCVFDPELSDELFHVVAKPGMIVADVDKGPAHAGERFVAPESGGRRVPVSEMYLRERSRKSRWQSIGILITTCCIVMLTCAMYRKWRRGKMESKMGS